MVQLRILLFWTLLYAVQSHPAVDSVNWDKLTRLTRTPHDVTNKDLRNIAQSIENCDLQSQDHFHLVRLTGSNTTCNDGSPSGYYIRRSFGSKKWIIHLEGGGFCYNSASCNSRKNDFAFGGKFLMTSKFWVPMKNKSEMTGILSNDPHENRFLWNANHVFVPYCSSDAWTGTVEAAEPETGLFFHGAIIVKEVVKHLVKYQHIKNGSEVILTGSSAGGIGVLLNVDRVHDVLHHMGLRVDVRGISDSGWFLDVNPYDGGEKCTDMDPRCPTINMVKKAFHTWKTKFPKECVREYKSEPWRCFFGYRVYPSVKSAVFVFQWMFDQMQMMTNNIHLLTTEEWDVYYQTGMQTRQSLAGVNFAFAPSCGGHTVLTMRDWYRISVNGVDLADAIRCWEESEGRNRRMRHQKHMPQESTNSVGDQSEIDDDSATSQDTRSNGSKLASALVRHGNRLHSAANSTDVIVDNSSRWRVVEQRDSDDDADPANMPRKLRRKERRERRKRRKQRRRQRKNRKERKHGKEERRRNRNNKPGPKKEERRQRNGGAGEDGRVPRTLRSIYSSQPETRWKPVTDSRCHVSYIDKCNWPQCNLACPAMLGKDGSPLDVIEKLKSLGLNLEHVAMALEMDVKVLQNMDHTELLRFLIMKTNGQ